MGQFGWRFWFVRPGRDVLCSPYDAPGASVIEWPSRHFRAACHSRTHAAPAPDCGCGVAADHTEHQSYLRMRHWLMTWKWRMPIDPAEEVACVMGQVVLHGPVLSWSDADTCLPEYTWYLPPLGDDYRSLRAASAEIALLTLSSREKALAARLALRYDVPVHARP